MPGGPIAPALQVGGRCIAFFLTAWTVEAIANSPWFVLLVVVWALSEVIRYPYYLCTTLNKINKRVEWLRYTAFIVLYPVYVVPTTMSVLLRPAALFITRCLCR